MEFIEECFRSIYRFFIKVYVFFKVEMYYYQKRYLPIPTDDFQITKVELFNHMNNKVDVTYELLNIYNNYLSKSIFKDLFKKYYIDIDLDELILEEKTDIRLKIYYEFKGEEFIYYYSLINGLEFKNKIENDTIELPLVSIEKMDDYRIDIIYPYYGLNRGMRNSLYGLFSIDCKHIKGVLINGKKVKNEFLDYIEKIKTPYLDFGLVYNSPVKIKWMLIENGYDIEENDNIKIEIMFLKGYMDDETYEYHEHYFKTENINNYFITDYMLDKIKKKNKDYGRDVYITSSSLLGTE